MPAAPRRFAEVSPALTHEPSGLRVWFTEPLGILTQVSEQQTHADASMVEFLAGPVSERLLELAGPEQRLLFVHDWRATTGYTREARAAMTEWALSIHKHIGQVVVCLGPEAPALVRMGISVAATAMSMAGVALDAVDDVDAALDRLDVRPHRLSELSSAAESAAE